MHISYIFLTHVFCTSWQGLIFGSIFAHTSQTLHSFYSVSHPHFHFVFIYEVTEFELDLHVWDFQPFKPCKDPAFLFICSLVSIYFTSASKAQILISKSWAIKYLALQQVHISTYFSSSSHNDLLICGPSDRTTLVYLEFIAIVIATTSSWYFPQTYKYFSFLFQDYEQITLTLSLLMSLPFFQ